MLVSAAPRLLPRSTESIWFSSPALDEDAALTEMEAALEAQVAAAHVSFCAVLALIAASVCRSFSRSETSTLICPSWVGRDGRVGSPPRTTTLRRTTKRTLRMRCAPVGCACTSTPNPSPNHDPNRAGDERHLSLLEFRTMEAKKKWTTSYRTRPRRISKARCRSDKAGRACLPATCGIVAPRPRHPRRAHTHARTHTHTHAHKPAVCILQAMRPSQSTERRAESPQRISTAAVPCWRRGDRGHSVGITRARHAFIPARHLCLHPEPRGVACGHCDETEFARRRGPKREPSRLCARGAAPTAVGSWRASCDACGVPRPR